MKEAFDELFKREKTRAKSKPLTKLLLKLDGKKRRRKEGRKEGRIGYGLIKKMNLSFPYRIKLLIKFLHQD